MKHTMNKETNTNISFNENFNCDKMRLLISDDHRKSFSEKFKNWLTAYTQTAREKIWVDIESYKAW
jgi:nicotinamide riboside kinase